MIQRHTAMLRQTYTSSCLPSQYGAVQNLLHRLRCKETDTPSPYQPTQQTPEPTPPLPSTTPIPAGNNSRAQSSQNVNLPAIYTYLPIAVPCEQLSDHDEDSQHDTDCDRDMLTDNTTYTGYYTICGVVMQLTFGLNRKCDFLAIVQLMTSSNHMTQKFGDHHYIYRCMINKQ
jgi:hypothetical protein